MKQEVMLGNETNQALKTGPILCHPMVKYKDSYFIEAESGRVAARIWKAQTVKKDPERFNRY